MVRIQAAKRYVNGEAPKFLTSPPPTEPIPSHSVTNADTQTNEPTNVEVTKPERSSTSPPVNFSFSELATEVEILTAKCEELEAAKDAAFDDARLLF